MRILCILALCTFAATGAITQILGGTWKELTDGKSTVSLRALVETNGTLIAVGDKGVLQTSTDSGVTWTVQTTLNVDGEDTSFAKFNFYDILVSEGRLVLVGAPKIVLVSDDDGATWESKLPASITGNFGLRAVAEQNGVITAVGSVGGVVESEDGGDTWAQVKPGNAKGFLAIAGDGDAVLVAVGLDGAIMSSDDDGLTWILETSGTSNDLWGVTFSGTNFVAVGAKGTIITSPDGITWTNHSVGQVGSNLPFFTDVAAVGSLLITSGASPIAARYSKDEGVTWTQAKVTPYGTATVAGASIQDVAVTTGGVYGVGLKGEVWFSAGSYELWISNAGYSGTSAAETADPDGDGLSNLTEYTLGYDPATPATLAQRQLLPVVTSAAGSASTTFTIPAEIPEGVTVTIEKSTTTLATASWTTVATRTGTGAWVVTGTTTSPNPNPTPTPSPITSTITNGAEKNVVTLGTGTGFFRLKFSR